MKKILFSLIFLCGIQSSSQLKLTRDQSFGNQGVFSQAFPANQEIIQNKILMLPDNSLLVIVNNSESDYLLKLTPKGDLDPTFADNGKLNLDVNNTLNAVLQGNKIIIYFGPKGLDNSNYQDSKIVRYNQNGTPDQTFGENGILNEVTESTNPQALSVLVLDDLSFLVTNSNSTNSKKFKSNGILDTSYGSNGEVVYNYQFPLGQFSNGFIATCDINSLSSSIFSMFHLDFLPAHSMVNLNEHTCHHHNGVLLQNKTNISTRMTKEGTIYSVFEYNNYPLADFSRLIVMKGANLDENFNAQGFVTSADDEQFLDSGYFNSFFFTLNKKNNAVALNAYSSTGGALTINSKRDFNLSSGKSIEMKDNFILVNSVVIDNLQNSTFVKIEKFLISNEKLSTNDNTLNTIDIQNPVKDYLNIINADLAESLEIYSAEGRKLLSSKNFKDQNVSNLTKGVYIIKFKLKDGQYLSKKILKE